VSAFEARAIVRVLVATDAAGEGLNLQKHCHRIIHFELPWNPNRLEQRNGRIDRYGQQHTPVIGFLYARDTYEPVSATRDRTAQPQRDALAAVLRILLFPCPPKRSAACSGDNRNL